MPSKTALSDDRVLVKALLELTASRNITFNGFSHNWIIHLKRDTCVRHVYGYNFDLNSSSAWMIANDKAGLSNLLKLANLPHVEHHFFPHPRFVDYLSDSGNWEKAIRYAESLNYNLVCKANQGTGGSHVYHIQNQRGLEDAFQQLLQTQRGLCLSPYYVIDREYRLIMFDGRVLLAYEKVLPEVTGDGKASFQELVARQFYAGNINAAIMSSSVEDPPVGLKHIPGQGEEVPILWKHNLGRGAAPRILNREEWATLVPLANDAMAAGGLSLAAVDLISTKGELRILEINCGIMLESFAQHVAGGYNRAKMVYALILDVMFPE